jgi:hypothetical protein
LNSPPPPLSFIPPSPDSWNRFNMYNFCIYIHVYTLFALYSSSYPLFLAISLLPLVPTPSPQQNLFHPPVRESCLKKKTK